MEITLSLIATRSVEGETFVKPRMLAVDIETYTPSYKEIEPEKNPIIMMGFYGENFSKVFIWKRFKTALDYVEHVDSEAELIKKFKRT